MTQMNMKGYIMRLITLSLVMVIASVSLLSAVELPRGVERAIEDYESSLVEAEREYNEALENARSDLERTLERERDRAERRNETEVVAAINAYLNGDEQGTMPTDMLGNSVPVVNSRQSSVIQRQLTTMSEEAWDSIPTESVMVTANGICNTGINVSQGEQYLIVPHPSDQWCGNNSPNPNGGVMGPTTNWQGRDATGAQHNAMIMAWSVGQSQQFYITAQNPISPETSGELTLFVYDSGRFDNSGSIRVKILRVE